MRILVVNQYAVPPSRPGGTRHYSLARALAGRGHEVAIIAGATDHTTGERYAVPGTTTTVEPGSIEFVWGAVPVHRGNGVRRLWSMVRFSIDVPRLASRALRWRPDVVVGSSPHPFAAWAALLWAKRERIPFVLEVRDIWPETLIDTGQFGRGHVLVRILRFVERQLYHGADAIVTLLPGAGEYLMAQGVEASRVHLVPNGVDDAILAQSRTSFPRRPPFVALYAGAHGHLNGLETLVRAAQLLQELGYSGKIMLRLVGDGPEKAVLEGLARSLCLGTIEFLRPVAKDCVPGLLAAAHVTVLHLRRSNVFKWGVSPNKLFDYMAARRAVVFAVSTRLNPIATSGGGISIGAEDPAALARALIDLAELSDTELLAMGERGREYAVAHHGVTALAVRYEKALQSAVNSVATNSAGKTYR